MNWGIPNGIGSCSKKKHKEPGIRNWIGSWSTLHLTAITTQYKQAVVHKPTPTPTPTQLQIQNPNKSVIKLVNIFHFLFFFFLFRFWLGKLTDYTADLDFSSNVRKCYMCAMFFIFIPFFPQNSHFGFLFQQVLWKESVSSYVMKYGWIMRHVRIRKRFNSHSAIHECVFILFFRFPSYSVRHLSPLSPQNRNIPHKIHKVQMHFNYFMAVSVYVHFDVCIMCLSTLVG